MELSLIILRCQQGNHRAWGQLYEATRERLLAVCRQYVGGDSVAEDLLHDAYLLIFEHLSELKDLSKADAWMTSVTRNLCLYYLRKENKQQARPLDEMSEVADLPGSSTETYEAIVRAIDELPEGYQRVFRLSVMEGLSHQQIATMLHIEPHSSSSQLYHAKSMLRRSLKAVLFMLFAIVLPTAVWYSLRQTPTERDNRLTQTDHGTTDGETKGQKDTTDGETKGQKNSVQGEWSMVDSPSKRDRYTHPGLVQVPVPTDPSDPSDSVHHLAAVSEVAQTFVDTTKAEGTSSAATHHPLSITHHPSSITHHSSPATHHSSPATGWQLALAYSGHTASGTSSSLPYANPGVNDAPVDTVTHHSMPITIGLSVNKMIGRRLAVGTGLQYTQLNSETRIGNSYAYELSKQRVRYLGIPLRLSYYPVLKSRWSVYGSANVLMELPLHSTADQQTVLDGHEITNEQVRLHPQTQWSVGLGLGMEYRLTPHVGFFVEPSLQYYFDTSDGISSWRTDHPLSVSLPLGVRVTF